MKQRFKFVLLLLTIIISLSNQNVVQASNTYPDILEDIIYPLGYDKNVFDTPFDEFRSYAEKEFNCVDCYKGFATVINQKFADIYFKEFHCGFYDYSDGYIVSYATYNIYTENEFYKMVNELRSLGFEIISKGIRDSGYISIDMLFKDILKVNCAYVPGGRIEFCTYKKSKDLITGFPIEKKQSMNLADILVGKWRRVSVKNIMNEDDTSKLPYYIFHKDGTCVYKYNFDFLPFLDLDDNFKWTVKGDTILLTSNQDADDVKCAIKITAIDPDDSMSFVITEIFNGVQTKDFGKLNKFK